MDHLLDRLGRLAAELQERHVFRVMAGYCPSAWLLIQLADSIAPNLAWVPDDLTTVIIYTAALGMPVAVFLAWRFNLTGEGLQRAVAGQRTRPSSAASGGSARREGEGSQDYPDAESPARSRREEEPGREEGREKERGSSPRTRLPAFAYLGSLVLLLGASLVGFVEVRIHLPWAEESELTKVAVLPYEDSGNEGEGYLTEGLTEQILSSLHAPGLGVISRNSIRRYRSAGLSLDRLDDDLGVQFVLEGSVRWDSGPEDGRRARITSQLVRLRDGTSIWSDARETGEDSLFLVGRAIAEEARRALGADASVGRDLSTGTPASPSRLAAEEYYQLAGEFLAGSPAPDRTTLEAAVRAYEEAVRIDPSFHRAFVHLARIQVEMYRRDLDRTDARLARARRAAEKARRLAPDAAASHRELGRYFHFGAGDFQQAARHYSAARDLTPNEPVLLSLMADLNRRRGDFQNAVSLFRRALQTDPWAPELHLELAETLRWLRRYDEAERAYREAIRRAPDWYRPHAGLAWCHLTRSGEVEQGRQVLQEGRRRTSDPTLLELLLSELYLVEGRAAQSAALLESQPGGVVWTSGAVHVVSSYRGDALRHAGRPDDATDAYESARVLLTDLIRKHPDDPRLRAGLGIVLAALGDGEAALREGERALALRPVSDDALVGPELLIQIARIHLLLGQRDLAARRLREVLSVPSPLSRKLVRADPRWSDVRSRLSYGRHGVRRDPVASTSPRHPDVS